MSVWIIRWEKMYHSGVMRDGSTNSNIDNGIVLMTNLQVIQIAK